MEGAAQLYIVVVVVEVVEVELVVVFDVVEVDVEVMSHSGHVEHTGNG